VPKSQFDELVHQYRTLQGIHRSQMQARGEMEQRIATLTQQVQTLTARSQQPSSPPPQKSTALTPEEIEEYGEDLIGVIEKKAREVAAPLQTQLDSTVAAYRQLQERNQYLESHLQGVTQAQNEGREEAFFSKLPALVPDWETLNYDAGFLAWLNQPNPFHAGETRKQGLDLAVQNFNPEAAAVFFTAYKAENPTVPVTPKNQPVSVPSLESQAQPAQRSTPDVVRPTPQGRVWTQGEITKFYRDVTDGKYRTNPNEKQRIEREIFTAQRENRIAA